MLEYSYSGTNGTNDIKWSMYVLLCQYESHFFFSYLPAFASMRCGLGLFSTAHFWNDIQFRRHQSNIHVDATTAALTRAGRCFISKPVVLSGYYSDMSCSIHPRPHLSLYTRRCMWSIEPTCGGWSGLFALAYLAFTLIFLQHATLSTLLHFHWTQLSSFMTSIIRSLYKSKVNPLWLDWATKPAKWKCFFAPAGNPCDRLRKLRGISVRPISDMPSCSLFLVIVHCSSILQPLQLKCTL